MNQKPFKKIVLDWNAQVAKEKARIIELLLKEDATLIREKLETIPGCRVLSELLDAVCLLKSYRA